jgi:hypothetical protein
VPGTIVALPNFMFRPCPGMAVLLLALCATAALHGASQDKTTDFSRAALDSRAPITAQRSYTLNAGVRVLLFWVRRDNVGSGTLTWRAGRGDHRVLEFLVGSDPDRAPRRINRWGFVAEEVRPPHASLLGIMTQSDEQSVDEANAQTTERSGTDGHPYRAIRTTIRDGSASGGVLRVSDERRFTYRDLEALLQLIPADIPARRAVPMPKGTRSGFLFALQELIVGAIDPCRVASRTLPAALPYVYNNTFYALKLRKCDFRSDFQIGDRVFSDVIRADLETTNVSTGRQTPFRLVYSADGDLKGVPLQIVFRPRWWFEAELVLDDRPVSQELRTSQR